MMDYTHQVLIEIRRIASLLLRQKKPYLVIKRQMGLLKLKQESQPLQYSVISLALKEEEDIPTLESA